MQDLTTLGLGLDHDAVTLIAARDEWQAHGAKLAAQVSALLGDRVIAVEHVGSTAVPGLLAKPILDLAVGVAGEPEPNKVRDPLVTASWEYRGDAGSDGGLVFVLEARPGHRVAHFHVVRHAGRQWQDYLSFRDRLRDDPLARSRYADAKQSLQAEFPANRTAYQAGKERTVQAILRDGPAPAG